MTDRSSQADLETVYEGLDAAETACRREWVAIRVAIAQARATADAQRGQADPLRELTMSSGASVMEAAIGSCQAPGSVRTIARMTARYFRGTCVRLIGASGANITGARVKTTRAQDGKVLYVLEHDSGILTNIPEAQLVVDLAINDFVENWAFPGRTGKVVGLDKDGHSQVCWEHDDGSVDDASTVKTSDLRTCRPTHEIGDEVETPLGKGTVTAVRNLWVTVTSIVDGRGLAHRSRPARGS